MRREVLRARSKPRERSQQGLVPRVQRAARQGLRVLVLFLVHEAEGLMDVESDTPGAPGQTVIRDHPFEPRGEWWSLCKRCGLGSASHVNVPAQHGPPFQRPPAPARPTERAEPPDEDDELPVGTGTEVNMLDAQMHLDGPPEGRTLYEVYCIDWAEPAGVETFNTEQEAREFAERMNEAALRCSVRAVRRSLNA